jgi:hypothetical protein
MRSSFYFSFLSFDLSGELEHQHAILVIDASVSFCFFLSLLDVGRHDNRHQEELRL